MITSEENAPTSSSSSAPELYGIEGCGGRRTAIDGVTDTEGTITGTSIEWADPIDLPVGDNSAGMAVFHVPQFNDPGRHHRTNVGEYFAWLIEVIDEVERVLERGGKLVVIAKAQESRQPFLDVATLLLKPLRDAGFTTPLFYTWVPSALAAPLSFSTEASGLDITAAETPAPVSSWRVVVACKNQDRRAGSLPQRAHLGLPYESTISDTVWSIARNDVWLIPARATGSVQQGDLPEALVSMIVALWSFVGDLIINPLAGSTVIADVAAKMGRRALCFEPDEIVLNSMQAGPGERGG